MAGTTTATRAPRKPRATAQRTGKAAASTRTTVDAGPPPPTSLPEVPGGALELVDSDTGSAPRDVLFRRNGVEYTVPTRFDAADTLTYLDMVAWQGSDVAVAWAMRRALGDAGMAALMSTKGLSDEALTRLVAVVHNRLTGVDLPKS